MKTIIEKETNSIDYKIITRDKRLKWNSYPRNKKKKNRERYNKTMMWEICWNIQIIVVYYWNIINLNVRNYIKL